MPKADPDYAGITLTARKIAEQEAQQAARMTLDGLLAEAQHLAPSGNHAHADIRANQHGFHIVVWDDQPIQIEGPEGFGVNYNPGEIITAGSGRTLVEAVQAANAGMKPRS